MTEYRCVLPGQAFVTLNQPYLAQQKNLQVTTTYAYKLDASGNMLVNGFEFREIK